MIKKTFTIITLFPNAFNNFLETSIIKKAINKNQIKITMVDIRKFADNIHQQVDDYPYGGGPGMVLQALPVINAILSAKKDDPTAKVILLSPQGQPWMQQLAYSYSQATHNYILVCGHYEGIDARVMAYIDQEISIGDYVLTGGELPAMVIIDSISRLLLDVIKSASHLNDSFSNALLDYPTYTRPVTVLNQQVPEILISGHHQKITQYRHEQALINTYQKRPDLLKKYPLSENDKVIIKQYQKLRQQIKRKGN